MLGLLHSEKHTCILSVELKSTINNSSVCLNNPGLQTQRMDCLGCHTPTKTPSIYSDTKYFTRIESNPHARQYTCMVVDRVLVRTLSLDSLGQKYLTPMQDIMQTTVTTLAVWKANGPFKCCQNMWDLWFTIEHKNLPPCYIMGRYVLVVVWVWVAIIVIINVILIVLITAVITCQFILVHCLKFIRHTCRKCRPLEPAWFQFSIVHFPTMIRSWMRDVRFWAVSTFPYCYLIIHPPDTLI